MTEILENVKVFAPHRRHHRRRRRQAYDWQYLNIFFKKTVKLKISTMAQEH